MDSLLIDAYNNIMYAGCQCIWLPKIFARKQRKVNDFTFMIGTVCIVLTDFGSAVANVFLLDYTNIVAFTLGRVCLFLFIDF